MVFININKGLKEEYSMNKTFSAEYDFSCVRQIACADRFACVLMRVRAIARIKQKGLTKSTCQCEEMILKTSLITKLTSGPPEFPT